MGEGVDNFDWVEARSTCSAAVIFEQLKEQLREDVDKRQKLREGPPWYFGFRFIEQGRRVTILKEGNQIHRVVAFRLAEKAIEVTDEEGNVKFSAVPTISDDGKCRLKVKGQEKEKELWQFRKMALDELFFEEI